MDVETAQRSSEGSTPRVSSSSGSERKELAWAAFGLVLWSAVVFGGIFGVGYVLGHAILHWW
jgi:Na+-driven multidrug efflux pump